MLERQMEDYGNQRMQGTIECLNSDFLTIIGCSGLVIDPSNTQIMYLATGDREEDRRSIGVLKSTDGGVTWATTDLVWTPIDNYKIRKIVMHPSNSDVMMVATDGGIFRTSDGWDTYTQTSNFDSYTDIEFKPGAPTTVYASSNSIYKSTDNGLT